MEGDKIRERPVVLDQQEARLRHLQPATFLSPLSDMCFPVAA